MKIYKFRNCFLNTFERRVIRDGKYLELTPKTFDVLQLLVERSGEIVSKDEMLGKVWDGSFVDEGNLPVHITKLRRLLDGTDPRRFIETAQGTGYRFIAPMESVSSEAWRKQLSGSDRRRTDKSTTGFAFDSVAVLPLRNESDNLDIDYLADGLTEGFINSLSRLPNLRVIARDTVFRYKNKEADGKEAGEALGVSAVLTGRIRLIKDHITISVTLIKVEDGSQLWGNQFSQPFSDIFQIQDEITHSVYEKLLSQIKDAVTPLRDKSLTQNSESYRLYLKGKYFQEKRTASDIYKAIDCYQKSVSHDPTNVYSYVELVECFFSMYFFDHISFAEILGKTKPLLFALEGLNQSVDVLQAMYGGIKMYLEWRFDEAEKHLRNALSINPNCLLAHYRYSEFLVLSGRFSEALEELHKIMLIDPLSPHTYKRIGRTFWKIGQYENALVYLMDALEMEPNDYEALVLLGAVLTELGKYSEALDIFEKSMRIQDNPDTLSMIGYVHALEGRRDEALQIVDRMKSESKDDCHKYAIKLARIYVALGEIETAFRYLDKALNRHEVDLIALSCDPRWARIRNEPSFRELVAKVGLPANYPIN